MKRNAYKASEIKCLKANKQTKKINLQEEDKIWLKAKKLQDTETEGAFLR